MRRSTIPKETPSGIQQNALARQLDKPQVTLASLFEQLGSSERGLTAQEAHLRLEKFGPNEPTIVRRTAGIRQLLVFFANPLVIILLIASLVSAALGEVINASIIVAMVLLSVALNFFQTFRSQRAVEQLRAGVALTSSVLRDGAWVELPRHELVPGDIIRLAAGDLVPADARLIQTIGLHVQQSALTGESMPVEKDAKDITSMPQNHAEASNIVFLGTSVVSGTATALIILTGQATAFGDIAARLAARPPETDFERGIRRFGFLIMRVVFFLVLFIIRTAGNPLRSRPSLPLAITTVLVVCIGIILPFTPLAAPLGFTPLPPLYFLFLACMIVTYLLLVEIVKRRLMRRLVK